MKNPFFIVIVFAFIFFSFLAAKAIPQQGHKVMYAGVSPYGVEVARQISNQGGNVVDVAVGIGLSMAVTHPYFAALGGGGFAIVKSGANPVQAVDFREVAPAATNPKYYLSLGKDASTLGGTAIGVPGFPAGLWELHKKYGKLPWYQLFDIPVKLARKGFVVSGEWVNKTKDMDANFNKAGKKYFSKNGKAYLPGDILVQAQLAKVLERFRDLNIEGFYKGDVAQDLVASVKATQGAMTAQDLANYKVRWLAPLETEYQGYKLYLMPPPSSGGVVIKTALQLVDRVKPAQQEALSAKEFHLLAETLNRAFRARTLLGDPDFHKNPLAEMNSPKYLDNLAKSIDPDKATAIHPMGDDFKESIETTHFSVLDSEGNAVALTVTLNGSYGSGVVSDKFGIALNNEMDDFTTRPGEKNMYGLIQGQANQVEAGKRPLSSMSPTLVEKNGKIVLSIGAPGGPRIISGVFQALYRILQKKMDVDSAIQAPRVHDQYLPPILYVEDWRFQPSTLEGLKKMGHTVEPSWNSRVYAVQLQDDGTLSAAFDSRGEGAAGGF